MIRLLKGFALFVVALVALFLFVVNFSSVESRYESKGELTIKGEARPKTIYIRIEENRWWVGLWNHSNFSGRLYLEIPNTFAHFYDLRAVGDQLHIYDMDTKFVGNFSTLSKTLALDTGIGFFDGTCTMIRR